MMLKDINLIGIAGAGTMGSGIAQIFSRFGKTVIVNDIKEEYLTKSKDLIDIFNKSLIEEGLMNENEVENIFSKIKFSTDKNELKDCDLIIECIVEKLEIKQDFWKELEGIVKKDAYFATNTSGLSINQISSKLNDKSRFIGMHFWNPAHIIPLVELIKGEETSDEMVDNLKSLLKNIGKQAVVVNRDVPGFIGNRLQFAAFREALHIVEQGIASVEDVDKAMKYGPGFRYPIIGPLETADLGGLDTFYNISSYLFKDLGDEKEVPKMLVELIENNYLGVKSKKGFYDYSNGKDEEAIKRRDRLLFEMIKHISNK
jgi:3-hydroxybutyryl-CoA dehydrogenase